MKLQRLWTPTTSLINNRCRDYQQFADEISVNVSYLQKMMDEPFAVSNPSAVILKRIGALLDVKVGYLLGETNESDAVWIDSISSWKAWMRNTPGIQAALAVEIKDEFGSQYHRERHVTSLASHRNSVQRVLTEADWDKRYKQKQKVSPTAQNGLFGN